MSVDRLEAGKTYMARGERFTASQVMGPDINLQWCALDENGRYRSFTRTTMPEEVGPVCPWVVRAEYRPRRKGDWLIVHGALMRASTDGDPCDWVLVIELNREAS